MVANWILNKDFKKKKKPIVYHSLLQKKWKQKGNKKGKGDKFK